MAQNIYRPYLTAAEAAAVRGVSYQRVSRAVRTGRLPAQRLGRIAVIARADLERWQPGRHPPPPARTRSSTELAKSCILSPHLAEQVLEQTALLEATIASIPDGVLITDVQGRVLYANELVYDMMGGVPVESAERYLQWDVRDADGNPVRPEDGPVARVLRGEEVRQQLLRARSASGEPRFASASAAPICLPDGQVRGVVVILRDITPEEEYDHQLSRERERLNALVDNSPEGIVMVDAADMTIQVCNKAATQILGLAQGKGYTLKDFVAAMELLLPSGEPCPLTQMPLARSLRGETCHAIELQVVRADGRRVPVLVNSAPLRGQHGEITGAVAVCQDITRLKETERLRDTFISMATHELKSPLTAIRGHLQLLQRRAQRSQSDSLPTIETVLEQTARLHALIDELLDMSRLQLGRLELQRQPTNLTELAAQVVEQAEAAAPPCEFRLEAAESVTGNWDPFRLEQVLMNLVNNAVKYSPQGGVITVRVASRTENDGGNDPGFAEVTVADQGIGIPPGQEESIFGQFHRAEQSQQAHSLGLGLFIARGIAERHGGRLWAESPGPGRGSIFRLRLPLA